MGFTMPGNTKPTQDIDKPCWAHICVVQLQENPPKRDGGFMDAVAVSVIVLASSDETQVKRTGTFYFNNPNMSHKDGGEFAAACQVRLAQACNINPIIDGELSTWDKATEGKQVDITWMTEDGKTSPAAGQQLIMKFNYGWDSAKKAPTDKIHVDGKHVYHLEDEDVASVPKSAQHLKLIGKEHLATAKTTATPAKQPAKATAVPPAKAPPKKEPAMAGATSGGSVNGGEVDLNDL